MRRKVWRPKYVHNGWKVTIQRQVTAKHPNGGFEVMYDPQREYRGYAIADILDRIRKDVRHR